MASIHHEVLIGVPPQTVYTALTTAEGLSAWWTPNSTAIPEVNSLARFPFSGEYFKEMKVIELKPAELVKWQCLQGVDQWVGTTLTFTLYPGTPNDILGNHYEIGGQLEQQNDFEQGTLLVFRHENWRAETPMHGECNYTWGRFLRSLKLYCETGKGIPFPNQHTI